MAEPDGVAEELALFPPALRALVEAERAAGNPVGDLGHSHPAPPRGAYVRLVGPLVTAVPAGLVVRERDGSVSSDEVTDDEAVWWVVGGPHPPPEPVDMDALRAAADRSSSASPAVVAAPSEVPASAWERFVASVPLDHERWHDGIGIDLGAIDDLAPDERVRAEALLLAEPLTWREVEALARLRTPRAEPALRAAAASAPLAVRLAVADHAPDLLGPGQLDALLVEGLTGATLLDGQTALLRWCERHHPPMVLDALWRCLDERDGDIAVHVAALLDFLLGPATSSFDWDHRPLYLRFHAPPGSADRAEVVAELRARCGLG